MWNSVFEFTCTHRVWAHWKYTVTNVHQISRKKGTSKSAKFSGLHSFVCVWMRHAQNFRANGCKTVSGKTASVDQDWLWTSNRAFLWSCAFVSRTCTVLSWSSALRRRPLRRSNASLSLPACTNTEIQLQHAVMHPFEGIEFSHMR